MPRYWNDANVFIEAHQKTYPIEMMPSFWSWLSLRIEEGVIGCPRQVYHEVAENEDHKDALAKWFQTRREKGLCVAPDERVTRHVGILTTWVYQEYKSHQATAFAYGADSWVVAHAMVDRGIVVTQESNSRPKSAKVRIPDVCKHFDVPYMTRIQMLKALDAKF